MQRCYLIELGGEKEIEEMIALELGNIDSAMLWIVDNMNSDAEYFNCNIQCRCYLQHYEQYNNELNFYAKCLIYISADDKIGIKVNKDECSDVESIIESNLSIISKITTKMIDIGED